MSARPKAASITIIGSLALILGASNARAQSFRAASEETLQAGIQDAFRRLPPAPDQDPAKVALGRKLFSDPRLSSTGRVSCASCHAFSRGGADPARLSRGVNGAIGGVNSPTIYNVAHNFKFFWNGRAATLEDQIEGPIHHPDEMGSNWPDIVRKLSQDKSLEAGFRSAYGAPPTRESLVDAIVRFERSLVTPNSPFDRYLGGDRSALSVRQLSGYRKFQNLGCVACHQGVNLGGNMFQTLGIAGDYFKDRGGKLDSDEGRYAVTRNEKDRHVFRVPPLRNVALTAPYFHDGMVATLEDAVKLMGRYQLGRELSEADINDLSAFLRSLTGETPESVRQP